MHIKLVLKQSMDFKISDGMLTTGDSAGLVKSTSPASATVGVTGITSSSSSVRSIHDGSSATNKMQMQGATKSFRATGPSENSLTDPLVQIHIENVL